MLFGNLEYSKLIEIIDNIQQSIIQVIINSHGY